MKQTVDHLMICFVISLILIVFIWVFDFQILIQLIGGWGQFLGNVIPQVRVRYDGVLFVGIGFVLCLGLLHWLVTWFATARSKMLGHDQPARWRLRHSVVVLSLFLMMFVIVIAISGVIHQAGWLVRSPVAWYSSPIQSDEDNALSPYRIGEVKDGHGGRSWIAAVAPFSHFMIEEFVDDKLPWNHPQNAPMYRRACFPVFNPSASLPQKSPDGMGLSHYAANAEVLVRDKPVKFGEVEMSGTILVGEVNQALEPWGMPYNCRYASAGINRVGPKQPGTAIGFGTPAAGASPLFAMLDGSVQTVNPDIDPKVLEQLGRVKPKPDP